MKSRRKAKQKPRAKSTGRRKPAKAVPARSARPGTSPGPLDDYIMAAARRLNLKIEKTWMGAVRANLQVTLAHAALVGEFPLPDDAEPAPVFRA